MALYPQFVLFGDSLVQNSGHLLDGFSLAAALQSRYIRRMDVINRGLSGYNTNQALNILPKIIPQPSCAHVEFLLVLFGANDASIPGSPTNQHVSLEEFKKNIEAIIKHESVTVHQPKIILSTPPPIDEARQEEVDASKGTDLCRRARITAQYAEAVREVAAEIRGDVILLDLWSVFMEEAMRLTSIDNPQGQILGTKELGSNKALTDLMSDGLHLSSMGYAKFYESLVSAIESKWPNSLGSFVLPYWRTAPRMK